MGELVGGELLIRLVDWTSPEDGLTAVNLLDSYAQDSVVGAAPLSTFVKERLPAAMVATPGAFSVIGFEAGVPIALANCFSILSPLTCKPVVKIQDLIVLSNSYDSAVEQGMLGFVEEHARQTGALHVSVEVLNNNERVIRSYFSCGFARYGSAENAVLLEKRI